ARPDGVVVFGRGDGERVADRDEFVVARLPARGRSIVARRPEIVIAGRPDHALESVAEPFERASQVFGAFPDIAGDNQPVTGIGGHFVERFAVAAVTEMQVTDRVDHGESVTTLE